MSSMGKTGRCSGTNFDYYVVPDRERQRYDMKFKIHVAREAQTIGSLKASQRYGVSKSNVDHWRRGIEKLIKKATNSPPFYNSEPKSGRDYAVEQFVLDEIRSSLKRGIVVTKKDIQEKASDFAKSNSIDGFKANRPWCNNFLLRNNIYDNFGDEDDDEVMKQEIVGTTVGTPNVRSSKTSSNEISNQQQPEPPQQTSSASNKDNKEEKNSNTNNNGNDGDNAELAIPSPEQSSTTTDTNAQTTNSQQQQQSEDQEELCDSDQHLLRVEQQLMELPEPLDEMKPHSINNNNENQIPDQIEVKNEDNDEILNLNKLNQDQ